MRQSFLIAYEFHFTSKFRICVQKEENAPRSKISTTAWDKTAIDSYGM